MTSFQLLKGLTDIDPELLAGVEQLAGTAPAVQKNVPPHRLSGKKVWLIAAVIALAALLVGCAVAYAMTIFDSPGEMISALYGGSTGAPPTEMNDPEKPGSAWTVPGYEKLPVEEPVARELEKWVSPVGKSIAADGYKLTVDAYVYDSTTRSGFITMLLEHERPISEEELMVGYNGEIGGLSGNYLDINQYGRAYLIPEKTTDTQLAFTYYFRADMRKGTNLLVSFPDFEEQARLEEYERSRAEGIAAIRQRLKEELTAQEAAEKLEGFGYGSGYTGDYDDYYYLAALEYDAAHADALVSEETRETQALRERLEKDLTPEEAVRELRSLWGDDLVEETFAGRMEELPVLAYDILAQRAYEQAHMEETVCVSLPDSGSLPCKTFGQGDVYVNSLCVRVSSSHYAGPGSSIDRLLFHMADGSDFVVLDDLTDNTLFKLGIENGDTLYMLGSAVNLDSIRSVEVVGNLTGATLDADTE